GGPDGGGRDGRHRSRRGSRNGSRSARDVRPDRALEPGRPGHRRDRDARRRGSGLPRARRGGGRRDRHHRHHHRHPAERGIGDTAMVFDFAAQPPELISAKIYSGPGAESLQAAASAWDGLSSELQSTAANFQSVIAGLVSGDWPGPSSQAAAAAAEPYVSWLSTPAGQAEQTAGQARAAAGAYETALAATVPPAE